MGVAVTVEVTGVFVGAKVTVVSFGAKVVLFDDEFVFAAVNAFSGIVLLAVVGFLRVKAIVVLICSSIILVRSTMLAAKSMSVENSISIFVFGLHCILSTS